MRSSCKGGRGTFTVTDLLCADDAALFFRSVEAMQKALNILVEELERFGLILSLPKTETMAVNADVSETNAESLINFDDFSL